MMAGAKTESRSGDSEGSAPVRAAAVDMPSHSTMSSYRRRVIASTVLALIPVVCLLALADTTSLATNDPGIAGGGGPQASDRSQLHASELSEPSAAAGLVRAFEAESEAEAEVEVEVEVEDVLLVGSGAGEGLIWLLPVLSLRRRSRHEVRAAVDDGVDVKVVLVERHAILRDGLRALLDPESGIAVVGEADSAGGARKTVSQLRPDVVITEIAVPGATGLDMITTIKDLLPDVRVLVLTSETSDEHIRAALELGADGYVLKESSRKELLEGIRALGDCRPYFCAEVVSRVVAGFLRKDATNDTSTPLTERELEVLKLVAMGYSTKRIALRLKISVHTVEKHRANVMRKLDVENVAAVTMYAVRNGLVPMDTAVKDDSEPPRPQ
jgi:DNA-binding NarL/FixJ family response regulator